MELQAGDGAIEVRDDLGRVLPLGHVDDALDHIVLLIERHDARAFVLAARHVGHVAHGDGLAVARVDHGATDVVEVAIQAERAHHQGLVAPCEQATAAVGAVVGQGV